MIEPTPNQSLLGRPFDQYQNLMQIARCVRETNAQLGVSHPRILELSRRPTGVGDYLPEADIVRHATHRDDVPTPSSWRTLPFDDRSFDVCLVTDAYEHIEIDERPRLLSEMIRVTRSLLLVGCPVDSELVTRFDRLVFDFIWAKHLERFEPLNQHVHMGVEQLETVLASLNALGAERAIALPCNYIFRWVHMILIYFDLQHRSPMPEICEPMNAVYNKYMSPFDYQEPCYRYLIVAALSPGLHLDQLNRRLQAPPEPPHAAKVAQGALLDAFREVHSRAVDEIRRLSSVLERAYDERAEAVATRDRIISSLQAELHEKVAERDALIRSIQDELHDKVAERDEIIRRLQERETLDETTRRA